MTDSSDKAKWDALAEMLGAKIRQPETPQAPALPEQPTAPRQYANMPPPARKRADWGALAGELGVGAEARSEAAPPPAKPSKREEPLEEAQETPASVTAAPGLPPEDRFDRPRQERAVERRATSTESWATLPSDVPETTDLAEDDAEVEELPFAEGASAAAEIEEVEPAKEGERGRRPRRRRRRGPRNRSDVSAAAADETIDEEPFSEMDEEPSSEADEEPSQWEESDDGDSDEGHKRASHKSIPSWAEAVGIIIGGNLGTRSSRRKSAPAGGRGRGRRGGRRS